MCKPHVGPQFVGVLVVCAVFALATSAVADTIYLKNGREILTSKTRIEGDNVIFLQYGGEVTIPLALVDRIVEDEARESDPLPVSAPASSGSAGQSGDQAGSSAAAGAADPNAAPAEQDPKSTRDYWQQELRAFQNERDQLSTRLEDLDREERAFLFSRRSTAETRRRIEDTNAQLEALDEQEAELRDEARKLNIPAGWLRLDTRRSGEGG
jgi:hypothetical protein